MHNYTSVVHQMEAFGVKFRTGPNGDLPLKIPTPKRKTCGLQGKWWYWLQLWRPRRKDGTETGAEYIVGVYGTYKHGGSERKVEIDFDPPTPEEKARFAAEYRAAEERAKAIKAEAAAVAALTAAELWRSLSRDGHSDYLERKGVQAESCRYVSKTVRLARRDPAKPAFVFPPGTLVLPLIRYDRPREEALRGLQLIKPDGFKIFTEDFSKNGCALRLGQVDDDTALVLACEGYATGLSLRMATDRQVPVYVTLDAYNLPFVVEILRELHPPAAVWRRRLEDGRSPWPQSRPTCSQDGCEGHRPLRLGVARV